MTIELTILASTIFTITLVVWVFIVEHRLNKLEAAKKSNG